MHISPRDALLPAIDLSARALLVATRVRVWSGEKRDRSITRELCDSKGAEQNAIRANKSLLGDAIAPVQTAERIVRAAVAERTLPWMDDGTRILKGTAYLAFTDAMAEPIRGFDDAVSAFIAAYPDIREQARRRLGDAYSDSDFPSQGQLRQRFGVKLTFLPIPSAEDFRVQLAADEIDAVRRNAEEALRGTVNDAVASLLERLREPVARMATRLRLFSREDGRTRHPFRDSLVENVRAIVQLAPMLNLMDDPRIAGFCREIEDHLTAYHPDDLRASPALRNSVADKADDILRRMQGAFA
ncbi:conserved protein of unknown function (plasmid) [Rhodovastum atsumiense]|uniref:DUF3150 domain-containing protein n=1 Tax=Rhodovastum atsumiense TaxID=504468 RepID=A0A5M6IJU0_9PROT|nr:hypothetical protein [Rhodovastum atsumiense]KAA5608109.1 hypothetical protein F1189_30670 [Rhodovastum atsumiense]CAH2605742.1 conserved protein of unknown function [Rhodovastum atsumiense]